MVLHASWYTVCPQQCNAHAVCFGVHGLPLEHPLARGNAFLEIGLSIWACGGLAFLACGWCRLKVYLSLVSVKHTLVYWVRALALAPSLALRSQHLSFLYYGASQNSTVDF